MTEPIPFLSDLAPAGAGAGIAGRLVVKRTSAAAARPSRQSLHRHPYHEVFWYLTGGGVMIGDFERQSFQAPALVVVNPGYLHTARLRPETTGWLVAFSADVIQEEGDSCGGLLAEPLFTTPLKRPVCEVRGEAVAGFTRLCNDMLREYQGQASWRDAALQSSLRLLLIRCARQFPAESRDCPDAPAAVTRRFLRELEESFPDGRQVRMFADRLRISPQRLIRCVRMRTGRTPGELIAERVLTEARRLLFHTERTVAEISHALGFRDPSYFGHFFKRHCGCTPGEARLRLPADDAAGRPSK